MVQQSEVLDSNNEYSDISVNKKHTVTYTRNPSNNTLTAAVMVIFLSATSGVPSPL